MKDGGSTLTICVTHDDSPVDGIRYIAYFQKRHQGGVEPFHAKLLAILKGRWGIEMEYFRRWKGTIFRRFLCFFPEGTWWFYGMKWVVQGGSEDEISTERKRRVQDDRRSIHSQLARLEDRGGHRDLHRNLWFWTLWDHYKMLYTSFFFPVHV